MFPTPPTHTPAVAGFLWPLLGIWKSLGNLKKFFEEFVYFSPALPGSHSQEEEGKEGSGGAGDRTESHKRTRAPREGGEHPRVPTSQPDPQLGFLGPPAPPQPGRKTPAKCCQAHPSTQGLGWHPPNWSPTSTLLSTSPGAISNRQVCDQSRGGNLWPYPPRRDCVKMGEQGQ